MAPVPCFPLKQTPATSPPDAGGNPPAPTSSSGPVRSTPSKHRAPPSRAHTHAATGQAPTRAPRPGPPQKVGPAALAGNRTRVNCLEGSYAHHYTTNAARRGQPRHAGPGLPRARRPRPAQQRPDAPSVRLPARSSALPRPRQRPARAPPVQGERGCPVPPPFCVWGRSRSLADPGRGSPSPPGVRRAHGRRPQVPQLHRLPQAAAGPCAVAQSLFPQPLWAGSSLGALGARGGRPAVAIKRRARRKGRRPRGPLRPKGPRGHRGPRGPRGQAGQARDGALRLAGGRRKEKEGPQAGSEAAALKGLMPPRRGIEPRSPA